MPRARARSAESVDAHASVRAALDRLPPNHARLLRSLYLEDANARRHRCRARRLERNASANPRGRRKKNCAKTSSSRALAIGPEPPLNHSFTRPSSLIVFERERSSKSHRPNHTLMTSFPTNRLAPLFDSSAFPPKSPAAERLCLHHPRPCQNPARPALPRHSHAQKISACVMSCVFWINIPRATNISWLWA